MNNAALFVSDENYLNAGVAGGVQLCTQEYLQYLRLGGFELTEFPVRPVISLTKRIKIRLGINAYDHYEVEPFLAQLVQMIHSRGIRLVLLNQLNLSPWVEKIRPLVLPGVKFIGLSHGNESADYLHDLTKLGEPGWLKTWKLGKLLVKENYFFQSLLDGIVVLTEQEVAINQWIGMSHALYLPRILQPRFLGRQPLPGIAGFVGTLDHLPNHLGITWLADELERSNFKYKLRLVGGPVREGREFAKRYEFIEYLGAIRDDQLKEEVKTWSVFLNPVFWYARGASTKLAQAICWGIPCLTTPAGKRGYALTDETIVSPDNTPKAFARALIMALSGEEYLNKLKDATERNATHFNVGPHIDRLKEFLAKISGKPY